MDCPYLDNWLILWVFCCGLAVHNRAMSNSERTIIGDVLVSTSIAQEVIKGGPDIAGILYPELPQEALLTLYKYSETHCRAIHVKAAAAFSAGLIGNNSERVDELCQHGIADLMERIAVDWGTFGNAYIQAVRTPDVNRTPVELRYLPARNLWRHRKGGYFQSVITASGKEKNTYFRPDEIIHLRPPCPAGGFYSLPDWIGAEGMMALAKSAVDYNRSFFDNASMPEYAIITKGTPLNEQQQRNVTDFFTRDFNGIENQHKTLYLHFSDTDTDVEFKRLTSDIKDADFVKLLEQTRDRMPIAHGVPSRILGIMQGGQLGGGGEVTGQLFTFEKTTLEPLRKRMFRFLLPVLNELNIDASDLRFQPLDLIPPDQLATNFSTWVTDGILSTDEARARLGVANSDNKQPVSSQGDEQEKARKDTGEAVRALTALLGRS